MNDENDIDDEEAENGEIEEVTLTEVEDDGEILALMDGRRLRVNPGHIPTAILWLPTSTLEISTTDEDRFFSLSVVLQGSNQKIRAQWDNA